jgi:hypothetical protein
VRLVAERSPGTARPGRPVVLAGAALLVVLVLVVARGPVALLAAAMVAVLAGFVLGVPQLLRDDGIDWDWLPGRAQEVPPEPGIAALRLLLAPSATDTGAPGRLQAVVRAIAEHRSAGGPLGARLTAYLDAPPRRLDLSEAEALIAELESLPTKESA